MWEAESYLEHLCDTADGQRSNAVTVALADAYNRCIEGRRRAQEINELRKRWRRRRVGGVTEARGE